MSAINTVTQNFIMRRSIKDITTEMGRLQEQMSTGLKAKTFADHGPANARRVISLRNDVNQIDSYIRSIDQIDMRAERAEIALDRIDALGKSVRETALKLGNRLVQPEEMARTAQGAFSDAYSALMSEVSGHFVFSGTEADQPPLRPFEEIRSGIEAAIAAAAPADDPDAIAAAVSGFFADEANWYQGGGPTGGVEIARERPVQPSVLASDSGVRETLTAFATVAFADPAAIGAENYAALVDDAQAPLTQGLAEARNMAARNGLLRKELETTREGHTQVQLYAEQQLIDLEQVDVFETYTKIQALQTQLQATFQTTAQLRQLTLTNYL